MKKAFIIITALIVGWNVLNAQTEARLLRFPTMSSTQIVFSYAGDLYIVSKTGGIARKLTNDIGYEMFAKFSPDGKTVAFSGQYDGNTEVYTMPADGGVPKRLTYTATLGRDDLSDRMGPNNIVMCWKDSKNIIYRSRKKTFNDFKGQLFIANTDGGLSEELPLPCGGFCSYNADKTKLAYNRVFREFRTWKYYKGGMADDIWIYDFANKKTENITNNLAQDIFPMWKGDVVYFLSDRDRRMNLFSYDLKTKETKKLTTFDDYDIKFPSMSDYGIIFENGGFVYVFDYATQKAEKINIQIADDFVGGRNELKDASKSIVTASLSPDGKRIAFGARGDVYTVPAKSGITRNLTQSSGAHDRNVCWSPDGKYIAFISDMDGDDELYIVNQDGSGKPEQLTKNSDTYKYQPLWSPDSKKLLWADKMLRLQYVDIDTKKVTQVDKATDGEFNDFAWSPDSKWIGFVYPQRATENQIFLYELATEKKTAVTESWYDASNVAFSSDGKYLLLVSNRDFNPVYSWTEWNHAYVDMSKVYLITLAKATLSPFAPVDDEVNAGNTKTSESDKKVTTTDDKTTKIDLDGIKERIVVLPVEASSYWNVTGVNDNIYYVKKSRDDEKASLMIYNLKDRKETKLGSYGSYEISADLKKMLIHDSKYAIIDLPKSSIEPKEFVDLSNMKVWVNQQEEWKQIYDECWRQMRDFFYDPNMHGVNWKAMHDKYAVLVPFVNHRADLTYIIGELIGELSVGHAYVGSGEKPQATKIKMGLLGADLSRDGLSGFYKINKILKGENWNDETRSPLTELGVDVSVGDFIIAVNGKLTSKMNDIYESLLNTAGKQVELTINETASETGSHKVIVIPTSDESGLYYFNWVQNNIKKVSDATNGEVGYIHIPDMGVEGLNEFVKHFYPQLGKKALIIDDRGNGGGNVSPMIIERINRELVLMKVARNTAQSTQPSAMLVGPKVCLIDCYSASDGDLFPYQFKKLGIGKLIGKRTWGGVVGIRGSLPLIDGGTLNKPEFAHYDIEGKNWIIEGRGVDPDIEVDNDPAKEYAGDDEQLNKAIQVIKEEMKTYQQELPKHPDYPNKTK